VPYESSLLFHPSLGIFLQVSWLSFSLSIGINAYQDEYFLTAGFPPFERNEHPSKPRQRFVQLLTDAELTPDEPLNLGLCEKTVSECDYACIRGLPSEGDSTPSKGPGGNEEGGLERGQDRQARLLLLSGQGSSTYGEKRLHIPLRDVYCGMPGWIRDPQARDGCQGDQTGQDDPLGHDGSPASNTFSAHDGLQCWFRNMTFKHLVALF